jgi:GT2 family glycosyltransferase
VLQRGGHIPSARCAGNGGRDDYEIILVNDASTDHTLERMQALAAADPHIRLIDNPVNVGFGGS